MEQPEDKKHLLQMANLISLGWALVLSVAFGVIFGSYLDKKLGTEPIFTLIFLLLGIAAGFRLIYKAYKSCFCEEEEGNGSSNAKRSGPKNH